MTADNGRAELVLAAEQDGIPLPPGKGRPFPRVDLAVLARKGVPPPELLCSGLLYRGGLHSLGGDPDAGKGTLLLNWAVRLLAAGHNVILIDEEGGQEVVVEKLLALGADPDHLTPDRFGYVEFPGRHWDAADWLGLDELCAELRPALVGFDSCGALLGAAGKDENNGLDVTPIYRRMIQAARKSGAAFVIIDHLTKAKTPNGRFARGHGSKLQLVDVGWFVEAVKPFSRHQSGLLKLTASKDRRGWLHREHEVRVEVEDGTIALSFTKVERADDGPLAGLSPAAKKLYAVLPEQTEALPIRELTDRLAERFGHGLTRQTASASLNLLAKEKLADCLDRNGQEKRWWRVVS
jgi:hypothetical protein